MNPIANPFEFNPYFNEIYSLCLKNDGMQYFKNSMGINWSKTNINQKMYMILISWLFDVAKMFQMKRKVLFFAVNYLDQFLPSYKVTKENLQLIGISALFVADKYESLKPALVTDYSYITANSSTKKEILFTEKQILNYLDYNLNVPTIDLFLEIYLPFLNPDSEIVFHGLRPVKDHAWFLAHLILMNYNLHSRYSCSLIAVSIICLSFDTICGKKLPLAKEFLKFVDKTEKDIKNCMYDIWLYYKAIDNSVYKTIVSVVVKKYSSAKYSYVGLKRAREIISEN